MDESCTVKHEIELPYKSYWQHLCDFFKSPVPIIRDAFLSFGACWTPIEAASRFSNAGHPEASAYCVVAAAAILGSLILNGYRYYNRTPEGLEDVPCNARRIAHWQRPRWQFRLAMVLLAQKLGPFDRELRDLNAGRSFVMADAPDSIQAYIRWIQSRIPNLENMIEIAKQLLVRDFKTMLCATGESSATPKSILDGTETLARFYGETVAFERASRAVMPPDRFKRLHSLQWNWSSPVRDGVHQMFQILQQLCECDLNATENLKLVIEFDPPPNVEAFCEELDRLEPQLLDDEDI